MANAMKAFPGIEVKCLDGKVRNFCMDLEAMGRLEDYYARETGNPDFKLLSDFDWNDLLSVRRIVPCLWAGFYFDAKKKGEVLEPADIPKFMNLGSLAECSHLISMAMEQALPVEEEEPAAKKKTPAKRKAKAKAKKKASRRR